MDYQVGTKRDIADLIRNQVYFAAFEMLDVVVENFITGIECDSKEDVFLYLDKHSNQEIVDRLTQKYDIDEYPNEIMLEAVADFRSNTIGDG